MLILRLAFRNIVGAGLRTWLNVFVLSAAFVMIIWVQGMIEGMNRTVMNAKVDSELGGGQYWSRAYDPYDPLTYEESHATIPESLRSLISKGDATAMLVTTGAIYPQGRIRSAIIVGTDPHQTILNLPSHELAPAEEGVVPAMIGADLSRETELGAGDYVTVRWRDAKGTFDADEVRIAHVVSFAVPGIDQGQIWVPLAELQRMLAVPGEASFVVVKKGLEAGPSGDPDWIWHDLDFLLADIMELIKFKSAGTYILYALMLLMGLLAIFDTQVLAIWRRRKEIGTLMALGMDRARVISLFTVEGALHGILALAAGAVYGIPLLALTMSKGIAVPEIMSDMGMPVPHVLYPYYGLRLVVGTTLVVLVSVTFVSMLPASNIAKLRPTDALRGKAR
jgi:ABC-type lipoprotein release transport system permease subunit